MAQEKTLAMKVLEGKKVPYEVFPYPNHMRDAEEIAAVLGVPAGQVFKTLVVLPPGTTGRAAKPLLVIIPADRQLNLKRVAQTVDAKKVQMATHKEAEAMTGLQVGGISALALLNKGFVVFLDASAQAYEQIYVSAGQKGLDVKLKVADLVKVTGAKVVDLTN
ncbi:MAG TPA: aminoacyl-tRNA deacylase [Chloroflexota bacterium]|nr:aminoacyl-tRNA deacylase [Chloroflexota bacterium]HUM71917.1 aminoacyl-tRNA deacylase [Chloroflexota bacterium]